MPLSISQEKYILTDVEDWHGQFNMTEMTRTGGDVFFTGRASVHPVYCTEFWVIQTIFTWSLFLLILLQVSMARQLAGRFKMPMIAVLSTEQPKELSRWRL